jgi:hypothetical protein
MHKLVDVNKNNLNYITELLYHGAWELSPVFFFTNYTDTVHV